MSDFEVPDPLRLANEWRDTLLATSLAGAVLTGTVNLRTALLILGAREMARGVAWGCNPPPQIVGVPRNPPSRQVRISSVAFAWGLMLLDSAAGGVALGGSLNLISMTIELTCTTFAFISAGGPIAVMKIYDQVWDWPRKGGSGGGTTETRKIMNLLTSVGKAVTSPSFRPAHRPNQAARVLAVSDKLNAN